MTLLRLPNASLYIIDCDLRQSGFGIQRSLFYWLICAEDTSWFPPMFPSWFGSWTVLSRKANDERTQNISFQSQAVWTRRVAICVLFLLTFPPIIQLLKLYSSFPTMRSAVLVRRNLVPTPENVRQVLVPQLLQCMRIPAVAAPARRRRTPRAT